MPNRREFLLQTAAVSTAVSARVSLAQSTPTKIASDDAASRINTYKIPQADLAVSRIAYGTAMLGIDQRSAEFIAKAVRAMHTAYEHGVTLFDLADVYGRGQSESALAQFLKETPRSRERIVIQSKCGVRLPDNWVPGDPLGSDVLVVDLSRGHIVDAVEKSLQRLSTEQLDILLLHGADHLVEPEEVARAFDDLHRGGKVRYFGVSNYNIVQLELLKKSVRQPLIANQIWLSLAHCSALAERTSYGGLVDYCRLQGIQVQAYSPLKGSSVFARPVLLNPPADAAPEIKRAAKLLADIAKKHHSTAAAVMIAWLLRHPAGIVPIIGASTPAHIIDSCAADRVQLDREEWAALLNAALPLQSV